MTAIRIVLADDHEVVRKGLGMLLDAEPGLEVVAQAGDVDAALRAVLGHRPAVLLLDLSLPGTHSSLEAIPLVGERCPDTATAEPLGGARRRRPALLRRRLVDRSSRRRGAQALRPASSRRARDRPSCSAR